MITIKKKIENGVTFPERQLTEVERVGIIANWSDEENYYYFTSDDFETPEWTNYINQNRPSIDAVKLELRDEVDKKTQALIFQGFEFGGLTFSMSVNAQINWSNFPALPEAIFPLTVLSKNDEPYELQFSDKLNFYMAALAHKNTHLQSGNALKQQINAMSTIDELKLFIDSR